jgi:hypothetical protein
LLAAGIVVPGQILVYVMYCQREEEKREEEKGELKKGEMKDTEEGHSIQKSVAASSIQASISSVQKLFLSTPSPSCSKTIFR